MNRRPYRGQQSFRTELEIETVWQGQPVLLTVDMTATGRMTRAYPASLAGPAEPSYFDVHDTTFELESALDDGNMPLPLTPELVEFSRRQAEQYVEAHRDDIEQQWADEAADRDEAAYWQEIDRRIDEAREER